VYLISKGQEFHFVEMKRNEIDKEPRVETGRLFHMEAVPDIKFCLDVLSIHVI